MKQISRDEAENLFQQSSVLATKIEHEPSGLKVFFQLSNDKACVIHYSHLNGQKTYFLDLVC